MRFPLLLASAGLCGALTFGAAGARAAPVEVARGAPGEVPGPAGSSAPEPGAPVAQAPDARWGSWAVLGGAVLTIAGAGTWLGADAYLAGALTAAERDGGEGLGVAGAFATGLGIVVTGIGVYAWAVEP